MENKKIYYSTILALMVLFLLIFIPSTAMASSEQNVSPEKVYAYVTNYWGKYVSVIDTDTNEVATVVPVGPYYNGVAVNPTATKVYVAKYGSINEPGKIVSVIDTENNTVTATVPVGTRPEGVAVTPDGKKVYVANYIDGSVTVINANTDKVITTLPVGEWPMGVAVSDGKVYVANSGDGTITIINANTDKVITTKHLGGRSSEPAAVAVSLDGKIYVANNDDGNVYVINSDTDEVIGVLPVGSQPFYAIAVNPNGTRAYVTDHESYVDIIDTENKTVIDTVKIEWGPTGVAVNPDGTKVYVANQGNNKVYVIDTANNSVAAKVNGFDGPAAFGQFIVPPTAALSASPTSEEIHH